MKFSVRDLECEFSGWKLTFARARQIDFIDFRDDYVQLPDDRYNEDGGLIIEDLTRLERKKLLRVSNAYLVKNLISATCEDEKAETEREKEVLIDFLSDDEDFRSWASGYINGEKKT